jgi:hypothetical protein
MLLQVCAERRRGTCKQEDNKMPTAEQIANLLKPTLKKRLFVALSKIAWWPLVGCG